MAQLAQRQRLVARAIRIARSANLECFASLRLEKDSRHHLMGDVSEGVDCAFSHSAETDFDHSSIRNLIEDTDPNLKALRSSRHHR